MKKNILVWLCLWVVALLFINLSFSRADDLNDTQIIDSLSGQESQEIKDLSQEIKFKQIKSCNNFETIMEDFIKNSWDNIYGWYYGFKWWVLMEADMAVSSLAGWAIAKQSSTVISSTTDYSKTNTQVDWVDESDILKTNGEYVFYFNQKQNKIYVINSPLDINSSSINLDSADILKTISLPTDFQNTQIYVKDTKLVIISTKYMSKYVQSLLDRSNKTMVITYDISDINNLKLLKINAIDGYYFDSRLIENKLYIVSRSYINWGPIYPLMEKNSSKSVDIKSKDLTPTEIDVSYTTDIKKQSLKVWGKKYSYSVSANSVDCNDIYYILPDSESMKKYRITPEFWIISTIDIDDTSKKIDTKVVFGSLWQMYVSKDSIYLANNFYVWYNFRCPVWAMCMMPWFRWWENSLVHKFKLGSELSYVNSSVIPWTPLNQYSMNEDDSWNFNIITQSWDEKVSTNLFTLDKNLKLYGSLKNIEPWEQFKSARYIWDKLYLVTFQQIDPLFVVDLKDQKNPKIIWELKIPWYSTYLHPYGDESNWVQYLIWLWYDTWTWSWGGTVNSGIKLDLYKIDYNNINNDFVSVEQVFTKTLWWQWSYSESLENPRMFVWDKNRKSLYLPLILQRNLELQNCNVYYDKNWKEAKRNCYPVTTYETDFAWVKWYNIDTSLGIKEIYSEDYKDILLKDTNYSYDGYINQWSFAGLNFRVGYLWDVIYNVNNLFGQFDIMWSSDSRKIDFK